MLRQSITSIARRSCCRGTRSFSSLWPESPKPSESKTSPVPNRSDRVTRHGANHDDDEDDKKRSAPVIIPYSQSLPSAGYQWCDKCQIRAHAFQKPCTSVGQRRTTDDDACAALPAGTLCPSARRYFRQQRNVMIGMAAVVFTVPSVVPPLLAAMSGF